MLMTCPECQAKISDRADPCPKCGFPIKLEHYGEVGFAVVLLTPDDIGGRSKDELQPRARQNVVLELGYFLARLSRKNVCALYRGTIEIPSDYMGVIYVPYDDGGGWRLQLAKELKAAGFSIDMNKAI